ncbi:MAG TPA: ATP phosphoribosyltransferase [Pyrinomonadaceae bacterium]|nr:ATP phosphoribosyltransferase [Pyrinomonadaceae bacterium]
MAELTTELTIAIPKGRLERETLELFAAAGLRLDEHRDSRRLACRHESGETRFIFVKPSDVPVYVEHDIADCGVVGRDVLFESEADLLQPLSLDIGSCRIAVTAPANMPENGHTMLRVATKYPRIASRYFGERGQPVEIIELSGSVELAPALGLADCIVDLVETGRTLRENGLTVTEVIAQSAAQLVVNRASYQLKAQVIAKLISALKGALVSAST